MSEDDPCRACSRRTVLRGIGATAAASVLGIGCSDGGEPTVDAGDPLAGTTMCGTGLCLDLTHPANANLTTVDGARSTTFDGGRVIVVRTSDTEFAVLSQICTHQGCGVSYTSSLKLLVCPCHGSRFTLTGSVARSPATRALKTYQSSFNAGTNTLTITG